MIKRLGTLLLLQLLSGVALGIELPKEYCYLAMYKSINFITLPSSAPTPLSESLLRKVQKNFADAITGSNEIENLNDYLLSLNGAPNSVIELERRLRPFYNGGGSEIVSGGGFIGPSAYVIDDLRIIELKDFLDNDALRKTKEYVESGKFGNDIRSMESLWSALKEETLENALIRGETFSKKIGATHSEIHQKLRSIYDSLMAVRPSNATAQTSILFKDSTGTEFEAFTEQYMGYQFSPFGEVFSRNTPANRGIGRVLFKIYRLTTWGGKTKIEEALQPSIQMHSLALQNSKFGFYGSSYSIGEPLLSEFYAPDPSNPNSLVLRENHKEITEKMMMQSVPIVPNPYKINFIDLEKFLAP